jgi:hypothetical protein
MAWSREGSQDELQQERKPPQKKAEVVARSCQGSVDRLAHVPGEVVAPRPVLVLEVTDRGLYG